MNALLMNEGILTDIPAAERHCECGEERSVVRWWPAWTEVAQGRATIHGRRFQLTCSAGHVAFWTEQPALKLIHGLPPAGQPKPRSGQ